MKFSSAFIFFLFITTLNGQSIILLEEDSVSQVHDNLNLSDQFHEFPLALFFKNNTNDSILVNWRRELEENCPLEWNIYTADPILSYLPFIIESPNSIPMSPIDSNFIIVQYFNPNKIAGCCDIKMIFYLEENPSNPIDTGYYHIEINSTGCLKTALQEKSTETINLYPNPSSDILNIENNSFFESIQLYDLRGTLYFEDSFSVPNKVDISSFPSGIYICKIKNKQGSYLTAKILKQ